MVRTDDDDWDAATGVGVTATFGATARAVAAGAGLLNDPFAEPLVRAAGVPYFARIIDGDLDEADEADNRTTAGLIDILVTHTRFLDGFLADAAGREFVRR
ncbi:leucine carboxyl methyltransferase family protein [Mycobacterium kansasii]|uniref:Leucine carboxyl methyltransferase family protein n=1 Tax=Mycobacterium kansasii TaxID=1768 RepID=A0A1V3WPR9_MYCKA|nr:leucine carboxyl methyltransferase family protein [Mycobacterium kansasii]